MQIEQDVNIIRRTIINDTLDGTGVGRRASPATAKPKILVERKPDDVDMPSGYRRLDRTENASPTPIGGTFPGVIITVVPFHAVDIHTPQGHGTTAAGHHLVPRNRQGLRRGNREARPQKSQHERPKKIG